MPANLNPEYNKAKAKYLAARTTEMRIKFLKEMISTCPKHKGTEKLLANLRRRLKKLKGKRENEKKGGESKKGIKKIGVRVVLCGITNTGKSSLLTTLTNAQQEIATYQFTTKSEKQGILDYKGVKFQIIDMPAINYENFNQGLANDAEILLLIINSLNELKEIEKFLENSEGKKIVIFNKSDKLNGDEKRKVRETLKSKKYDNVLISIKDKDNLKILKDKLLENSGVIRIYTKQPEKDKPDEKPVILEPSSTVKDVAEKIVKGLSDKIKSAHITGPSSKFPNQKVGLDHKIKDKDIVEFKTK